MFFNRDNTHSNFDMIMWLARANAKKKNNCWTRHMQFSSHMFIPRKWSQWRCLGLLPFAIKCTFGKYVPQVFRVWTKCHNKTQEKISVPFLSHINVNYLLVIDLPYTLEICILRAYIYMNWTACYEFVAMYTEMLMLCAVDAIFLHKEKTTIYFKWHRFHIFHGFSYFFHGMWVQSRANKSKHI